MRLPPLPPMRAFLIRGRNILFQISSGAYFPPRLDTPLYNFKHFVLDSAPFKILIKKVNFFNALLKKNANMNSLATPFKPNFLTLHNCYEFSAYKFIKFLKALIKILLDLIKNVFFTQEKTCRNVKNV